MKSAEQIARMLFDAGVRLKDQADCCALIQASEATKTEAVRIYFTLSINRHDEFVTAMGDFLSEPEWFPHIGDHAEIGRVTENALYAYVEKIAGDEIDEELWYLQVSDTLEKKALTIAERAANIGLRIGLPKLIGVAQ